MKGEKEKVKKKYPKAYFHGDTIWSGSYPTPEGEEILGFGDEEEDAWVDASSKIIEPHNARAKGRGRTEP